MARAERTSERPEDQSCVGVERTPTLSNNQGMKRIALSFVCGILIPFFYAIIAGLLSEYIENRRIHEALIVPVRWPLLIYNRLFLSFPPGTFDISEAGMLLIIIFGNIFLYGLLTYLVMAWLKPKKRTIEPPPPPGNTN